MREIDLTHPTYVSYIEKSRTYYLAQGHQNPYRWAHLADVPFASLPRPLEECRIGLLTTASLHPLPTVPRVGWKSAYAAPWDPTLPALFTDDLSWDKDATHTDDRESYVPLQRLQDQVSAGRIGSVPPRFYGVPTEFSQRLTIERDAPCVAEWCNQDGVNAVLLVPL